METPAALSFDTSTLPLDSLSSTATSYASANGLQVEKKHKGSDSSYFESAPISLLPNAYPAAAFRRAVNLAPVFNELVDRVSRDGDFLQRTLEGGGVADADPYTAKLLQLYLQIYCSPAAAEDSNNNNAAALRADRLGIHRSDYMLNAGQIKQVELNTIASSFGSLACKVASLHRYLVSRFASNNPALTAFLEHNKRVVLSASSDADSTDSAVTLAAAGGDDDDDVGVPVNPALERLPAAMNKIVERYRERFLSSEKPATATTKDNLIVLFVVQEGESNTVDQRLLEFQLWERHQIPVVRMSLTKLHRAAKVDAETGALMLSSHAAASEDSDDKDCPLEVAAIYYRAGYVPTDYPDGLTGVEWRARATLEMSRAAKCPSLGYHLAGTKKVQQELARPGVLERFFPDEPNKVNLMRTAFAGLYSLGEDCTDEDLAAVRDVLENEDGKDRFVLKPQREGGGYNFYGQQLKEKLQENVAETTTVTDDDDGKDEKEGGDNGKKKLLLDKKLGEFILMERLFPPQQQAVLLRSGRVEGTGDSVSELGAFGTIVATPAGEIVHNEYAGFLLRTKFSNVDEGGVASGFATLSSPYLC